MAESNHPGKAWPADADEGPGHWFACDHPERPPTRMTLFMTGCEPCDLALHAALKIEGSGWYGQHEPVARLLLRAASTGSPIVIGRRRG